MYKLIAVDLDGTLLNSYGEITERTKNAIKKAIDKGVEIVLASGRPIASVENLSNEIGANNFLISGNGAIVYDIKNEEIIYDKFLTKKQLLNIIDICEENSIYYNVYSENEVITKALNYNTLFYHKENEHKEEEKRTTINIVSDVRDYILKSENENFLKVTVCDQSQIIFNSITKKMRNINDIDVLDVAHMSRKTIKSGTEEVSVEYYYTEITNKDVNKWTALEDLLNRLNIKKDEVIGIGDNINDKELVEEAGLGVAMGNSSPQIKEIADYVAPDNNSDGVAEVIEKFVL
ncbi:MAG: HAD family phosphatase [Clostridia bacterium]|nr:HAD family phosphatase [Clostridia bacterium]